MEPPVKIVEQTVAQVSSDATTGFPKTVCHCKGIFREYLYIRYISLYLIQVLNFGSISIIHFSSANYI